MSMELNTMNDYTYELTNIYKCKQDNIIRTDAELEIVNIEQDSDDELEIVNIKQEIVEPLSLPIGERLRKKYEYNLNENEKRVLKSLNKLSNWKFHDSQNNFYMTQSFDPNTFNVEKVEYKSGIKSENFVFKIVIFGDGYEEPNKNSMKFKLLNEYNRKLPKYIDIIEKGIRNESKWKFRKNFKINNFNMKSGYLIQIRAGPIPLNKKLEIADRESIQYFGNKNNLHLFGCVINL
jgi:hypothetical protein